jgi:7-keto-8-aminopelargonate synthetase-like enzyme
VWCSSAPQYVELESELADLHGKEAALFFTSACIANDATLSTQLSSSLFLKNHASMIEGIRHGNSEKYIFRHNDVADLAANLEKSPEGSPKVIADERVYSMDGHIASHGQACAGSRKKRGPSSPPRSHHNCCSAKPLRGALMASGRCVRKLRTGGH